MEALLAQFAKAKENPADFNGWTALISAADKLVRFFHLICKFAAMLALLMALSLPCGMLQSPQA